MGQLALDRADSPRLARQYRVRAADVPDRTRLDRLKTSLLRAGPQVFPDRKTIGLSAETLVGHVVDILTQKPRAAVGHQEIAAGRVLGAETPRIVPVVPLEARGIGGERVGLGPRQSGTIRAMAGGHVVHWHGGR